MVAVEVSLAPTGATSGSGRPNRVSTHSGASIEPAAVPRSVAVGSLGRGSEHGERGVQAVPAASVGLVVGFGRDESDQLVQVVLGGRKCGAVALSS